MLKEIKTRPVIAPQPVLIIGTYAADGTPDAMNVAWGGQCWDKLVALNISTSHKTTENMRIQNAFTLHIADAERVELADYFGITSGKDPDKLKRVNVTTRRGEIVNAPIIEEFVLAMECKILSMTDNGDGGTRVVAEVVRTVADDTILDGNGHVDYARLRPIVFDSESNSYHVVGEKIADAFRCGKELINK